MNEQLTRDEIMAMEAGPEMDALVAIHIMGWKLTWSGYGDCKAWTYLLPKEKPEDQDIHCFIGAEERPDGMALWSPSRNGKYALEVISKMSSTTKEYWTVEVFSTGCVVRFSYDGGRNLPWKPGVYEVREQEVPLAICRAALLATLAP